MPSLEEIRDVVEREWRAAERRKANDTFYERLRQKYAVSIEMPAATSVSAGSTETD